MRPRAGFFEAKGYPDWENKNNSIDAERGQGS